MDCVLDEELLANMKRSDDEDTEDQDDEKMELEQTEDQPEALCQDNSDIDDPLQDASAVSSNFPYLFQDQDIQINNDQLADMVLKPEAVAKASKRGRGRPSAQVSNYTAANGLNWSLERNALEEELVQPTHQACGKGPARTVTNAVESWMLLFDDDMLRLLQRYINEQIRKRRQRTTNQRLVDLTELRSWLGLNYLCGIFRNAQHNGPLEELWTLELGNAIFRATMTLARFEYIAECVAAVDKWTEAHNLWQKLIINCRSYYGCSGWLVVDEVMPSSKEPTRLSLCCDAKTLYLANACVMRPQMTQCSKELEQLICDFKTTGRNVTLGESYVKVSLGQQLMQRQLSSVGLMEMTSEDWPKNWPVTEAAALYCDSSKLVQQENGLNGLLVTGLSSQVNAEQAYHHTHLACKQFHELSQRFSTNAALPRHLEGKSHPFLQLLQLTLNMAAVNAWILLRLSPKGEAEMEQRDFQRQLGLFLTQQRLQRRLQRRSTTTTLVMRLQICEILGQSSQRLLSEAAGQAKQTQAVGLISSRDKANLPEGISLASRYGDKHRRCKPCSQNKRETKARSRCQQCLAHRCGNHLISRCYECMGVSPAQIPEGNLKDGS